VRLRSSLSSSIAARRIARKDHGVRRNSGRKSTAIFSAFLFAGSQSARAGVETSEGRYDSMQREGEIIDAFLAAQRWKNPVLWRNCHKK
jgi:hypothetical protein